MLRGAHIANFAIIFDDPKVRNEIAGYLREVSNDAAIQEFSNSDEFDKFYFSSLLKTEDASNKKPKEKDVAETEADSSHENKLEDTNAQPLPLDIVIVGNEAIKNHKTTQWVTKAATLLRKAELWPEENRPKFIILRFEENKTKKSNYSHPFIDDLIFLPADRLIVLQKIELILNLPKQVSPSFLYVQETNEPIQVAKKVTAVKMSDLTITTENPLPMVPGAMAKLRFLLDNETQFTSFYGRVLHSEIARDETNMNHVTFAMSLASKQVIRKLRNHVTKDVGFKILSTSDPKAFDYNPDNIFLSEAEKAQKTIVIIDPDEAFTKQFSLSISKEIGNTRVITETSWASFYQKYLSDKADEALAATTEDFYQPKVDFTIKLENSDLIQLHPDSKTDNEDAKLFGWELKELFENKPDWKNLISAESTSEQVDEILKSLSSRKMITENLALSTKTGERRLASVQFELDINSNIVTVSLAIPDASRAQIKHLPLTSLDAILINETIIAQDPASFQTKLAAGIEKKSIATNKTGPACFALTEKENFEEQVKLLNHNIKAVFNKPVDVRQTLHWLSFAIGSPFCIYTDENLGQKEVNTEVMLSSNGTLKSLSEFGASFIMPNRLKAGSMFYLFGSIFKNAPSANICCRVYSSKEDETEKGSFINSVLYFGINDSFLKLTRNFIREAYASAKAKDGNG